jgi:hypothetical protein
MASSYKKLDTDGDIVSTRTLLHESIPLTGTIVSGTYGTFPNDTNVKNYSHGMFQSVYDYPYLSSSANHIYDLTFGYSTSSALEASTNTQNTKKINIYNQMSQVLVGYDTTGSIREFDEDGDFPAGGTKLQECMFINFSRLLAKDEIQKGSFTIKIGTGSYADPMTGVLTIQDTGAALSYKVNSPAGEYGILKCASGAESGTPACGLIFYQAGVAVLSGSIFTQTSKGGILGPTTGVEAGAGYVDFGNVAGTASINEVLTWSSISGACDDLRHRTQDISFNNTTELNSTIHFCRVNSGDFNYSSNPTYLTESKIRVKNTQTDSPISYFTTVGLYSADNELLAVAKLSEPLKKTPANDMTVRVRLDY